MNLINMLLEDIQVTPQGKFISTKIFLFIANGNSPKRIYVRRCYEDVIERVILPKLERNQLFWISGTKGIGKSTLGLYLLYYFVVKARVPVLYKSAASNACIFDPEKGVAIWSGLLDSPHLSLYQQNSKTIVIADDESFQYDGRCTTIFITSIKQTTAPSSTTVERLLKNLRDLRHASVVLPPWTWAEIETCTADFGVTPDVARDRYSQFGGIPRYVLSQTDYDFSQIFYNLGSITQLWSQLCDQVVSRQFPSYILHYFPELEESGLIDYSKFTVDFGSKLIAKEVIKRLEEIAIQKARNFILSTEIRNGAATFRGSLFEGLVVMDFQKINRTMKSCPADSKDTCDLLIKKKKGVEMRRAQDINLVANEFYYDDRDNFESIDAAFLMSIEEKSQLGLTQSDQFIALLQITIAKKHDVKRKGLAEVIEHCKKIIANAKFILVFVLSEAAAPNFGSQKIVNQDDSETVKNFNIPQYIWRVPIGLESI